MGAGQVSAQTGSVDDSAKAEGGTRQARADQYVGISHYHADHTGQVASFPGSTVLIGAKEWEAITAPKRIVKVMAGNQRTTPEIVGVITRVSADLAREQQPQQQQNPAQPPPSYYTVRITLPAEQVARLKNIRLVPGMPVEAFIQTHERSPLQYLLKPLHDQVARTFRER